jgi:Protein of unknown function (DUF3500)
MSASDLAATMRSAALGLLRELDDEQRALAALSFGDEAARRWVEYRPERRPGACLALFSVPGRKAAYKLLASGLSDPAFAQAMAIISLEEVLDRREQERMHRHIGDYWVTVFGDPAGAEPWSWRFEGHHLSVSMTVLGDEVSPVPVFLGANPARISHRGRPVVRPLGPEEDLARELLEAMGPAGRAIAMVAGEAPGDIRSSVRPRAEAIEPLGVPASALGPAARALLDDLVALYLERLPDELASREARRIGDAHFAWEGPSTQGLRHYYRIQADDLLIEYDTTDDGNHAHTVLRRPRSDFGDDILAAHYVAADHGAPNHGAANHGAANHGAANHGASQHGASQHAATG